MNEIAPWKERKKARAGQRAHKRRTTLKRKVIAHYGGKCEWCYTTDVAVLCIDHIENDGADHRRELGFNGASTYAWLKKNRYPQGFQVLCANCNFIKEMEHRKEALGIKHFESEADKKVALEKYTNGQNCCQGCGEKNIEVLTFIPSDEIKATLDENAKKKIIDWIKANNYPEGFQVLCMNCNLKRYTIE